MIIFNWINQYGNSGTGTGSYFSIISLGFQDISKERRQIRPYIILFGIGLEIIICKR